MLAEEGGNPAETLGVKAEPAAADFGASLPGVEAADGELLAQATLVNIAHV